jgi:hypothetical protein
MKKVLFVLLISVGAFASGVSGYYESNVNYAKYLRTARSDFNDINKILDKVADTINQKGSGAFSEIKTFNSKDKKGNGIFVIDPGSGKLLVSPPVEAIGDRAIKAASINGKALAREAIREAQAKLVDSPWERWTDFVGALYKDYFTRIAITETGKVYVIAIGKTNVHLQHLFIEKLVEKACELITKKGFTAAKADFDKANGIFKFQDTYIFVYQVVSKDKLIGVYNPNYPEHIGNNVLTLDSITSDPFREMLKLQNSSFGGWVDTASKPIGESKLVKKTVFVKFIKSDGKVYMVGSGVYLDSYK